MRKLFIITVFISLFFVLSAYATPVPDTGQTTSYTATFGEDSDYNINSRSYTDLGNGIVRDNVTGLEWEVKSNKDGTTWKCDDKYRKNRH